jgi:hypothetical protein
VAIGSAIVVIRHRVGKRTFAPAPVENDNIGQQLADKIQGFERRRRALEWNYVETAMGNDGKADFGRHGSQLVPPDIFDMI